MAGVLGAIIRQVGSFSDLFWLLAVVAKHMPGTMIACVASNKKDWGTSCDYEA